MTFITGHGASGGVPEALDWRAIAAGAPVIVLYMALRHLPEISAKLIAAGRSEDEPVALISRASLADQRVLETTLGACAGDAEAARIEPPALIVIGEVVRLRDGLDWLGAVAGKTLRADPLGGDARAKAV